MLYLRKKCRILALVTAFAVALAMMPAMAADEAQAEELPEITYVNVNDTEVTEGGAWKHSEEGDIPADSDTDYNYRYVKETNTLYLKDANLTKDDEKEWSVVTATMEGGSSSLDIVLEGTNTISVPGGSDSVYFENIDVNISGSGSLTSTPSDSDGKFYLFDGDLTVSGCTLEVTSDLGNAIATYDTDDPIEGRYNKDCNIKVMKGATVIGDTDSGSGILAEGSITVTDSTLKGEGKYSPGIMTYGKDLTVNMTKAGHIVEGRAETAPDDDPGDLPYGIDILNNRSSETSLASNIQNYGKGTIVLQNNAGIISPTGGVVGGYVDKGTTSYSGKSITTGNTIKSAAGYAQTAEIGYIDTPAAPSKVSANLYGYNDIKASWGKVTGASGYYVQYMKSGGKWSKEINVKSATSYKKANLISGAKYRFKVTPYVANSGKNFRGDSRTSAYVYTLKKVGTPKVSRASVKKVRVKWINIYGETGYQISKSAKKKGTNIVSTYKTAFGKYKTIYAKKGKTYYYKVRAYKTVSGKKIYAPWSYVKAYKLK